MFFVVVVLVVYTPALPPILTERLCKAPYRPISCQSATLTYLRLCTVLCEAFLHPRKNCEKIFWCNVHIEGWPPYPLGPPKRCDIFITPTLFL